MIACFIVFVISGSSYYLLLIFPFAPVLPLSLVLSHQLHLVMSGEPPPLYTPDILVGDDVPDDGDVDPQILIIPTSSDAEFQKGYLGVEDERAAVEGELQIKGIRASACQKV